ncbi:MAG: flavin reductase family protein [Betaproteobacteria bacterium]|nr:flavin reductase family protein [Betaproteobacteria bacterium]NBT09615.1 flavin reductase family protein [Betaproteobacteria bacterium]NBU49015.1 flavin reductase family protein [Betaproteobacteria bacterium]NBX96185.1 flavin reductase family protein [Betaproteobacteria bacterium]
MSEHFYEPRNGHGLKHDPFNSIVGPRTIGWISTRSTGGVLNLAPYSFFNGFNYVPPLVGFSSIGAKDSLRNIEATGEFAWSLVTAELAQAMNETSIDAPPEIDEFEMAGLTPAPSRLIAAPRVAQSPVSFECRLTQIHRLKRADGTLVDTWMVFGEVVGVHIDQALIVEGVYRTTLGRPVLRGGGAGDYFSLREEDRFEMRRPQWAHRVGADGSIKSG